VSGKDFTRKRVFSFGRIILFQINIATKSLNVELSRYFKRIKYNSEEKSYSKQSYSEARMKMKHDVINKIAVNTYLERYEADERNLADKHLSKIKELTPAVRNIILMDRGYPSLYLFTRMLDLDLDFVVRCNDMSFIREIKEFVRSEETDKIIEVDLTSRLRKYLSIGKLANRPEKLILRAVKIKLINGITEYLISSLTDNITFTKDDLKELYHLRWDEETYFNFQKNVLEIENFSRRTPETIRQDYYARILSSNICSLIIEDAQEVIDEQVKMNDGLTGLFGGKS
jgi:hypothetical protein